MNAGAPCRIPFRGARVAARVWGDGPAVLLAHNAGNDHHNWDPQIRELARTHTVVAVDLAGFGDSGLAEAPTLSLYADQLAVVLDALSLDTAAVVGHCVGGAAAWQLARTHPDRVARLALLSPATFATMRAGPYGALYRLARSSGPGERLATALARATLAVGPARRASVRVQFGEPRAVDPSFVAHCDALYARPDTLVSLRAVLLHFDSFAVLDDAGHPGMPTLLVWGTANRILPFAASEAVRRRLQPDHDVVLDGAGHLVMQERPEAVTDLLTRWLDAPVGAARYGSATEAP